MDYIDLHTHTNYSDGTLTPADLMKQAAEINLKAISVTDHDTLDAQEESAKKAIEYGIEFIPGVEIAAAYKGQGLDIELHILGYYIDTQNRELVDLLESLRLARYRRNDEILAVLNRQGISVNKDDIKKISGGEFYSRVHIARYLINQGLCIDLRDAFWQYLGKGKIAYVKRQLPDCQTAFQIIKKAGGVVALAHPVKYNIDYWHLDNMVEELKALGLDAIEAIYSANSPQDEAQYKKIADKYSLIITGGSDFHGENKPGLQLGCGYGNLAIGYEVLEPLKSMARD